MPFNSEYWNDFEKVYYKEINRLSLTGENFEIDNNSPAHATFLINALIISAKSKIRIFSDHLVESVENFKDGHTDSEPKTLEIYGNKKIIQNAVNFLKNENATLEVVVENAEEIRTNKFVQALKDEELPGTFKIVSLTNSFKKGKDFFAHHFMVSDDKAYRFEKDPHQESFKAFANFGDSKFAGDLSFFFDNVLMHQPNHKEI